MDGQKVKECAVVWFVSTTQNYILHSLTHFFFRNQGCIYLLPLLSMSDNIENVGQQTHETRDIITVGETPGHPV